MLLIKSLGTRTYLIVVLCLALGFLTACGGGGGGPITQPSNEPTDDPAENPTGEPTNQPTGQQSSQSQLANPSRQYSQLPANTEQLPAVFNATANYLGVGVAFATQSPSINDLPQNSEPNSRGFTIRSGNWRDSQGRDGSHNAADVLRYLQSFVTEERKTDPTVELYSVDFGASKTLRMYNASSTDRRLLIEFLQEFNTAVPYDKRILLGDDLSGVSNSIPLNEIHVIFTSGKNIWLSNPLDDTLLGIASARTDNSVVTGGYVYIDRDAIAKTNSNYLHAMRFVIAHEIIHAYGMLAHADPTQFPESILVPKLNYGSRAETFYLTIDAEGLLAESKLPPKTQISALTANDLGSWSDTGFHLVGAMGLDNANNEQIQFGSGYRNGLSKPWGFGPKPSTRLRDNSDFTDGGSATWNGGLLGFSKAGKTVTGDAEIIINFQFSAGTSTGSANFDNLESWNANNHPGDVGSGSQWGDGDLRYTLEVVQNGNSDGFVSTGAQGDDSGIVTGAFAGTNHEGAVGVVEHPDLSGGFGAKR